MVKLLLVEDEEKIRKGIKNVIDWEALGINIYGEASNGYEALKLASGEPPDIILTDIKMPIMDGLQLIERLKKEVPGIKSIIMSGYDDFDYIQRAIKLGASDYILKPSGAQEIQDIVEKVKNQILEDREREIHLQNMREQFKESISLMKEKYLNKPLVSKGNQLEISAEKFLSSDDFIALYQEAFEEDILVDSYPQEEEKELLNCIKSGSEELLITKLDQYFSLLNRAGISKDLAIKSVLGLFFSLYHFCIERNINTDEIFGENFSGVNEIQKSISMHIRKEIIIDISRKIYIAIRNNKGRSKILKNAVKFIEDNYYRDLNRKIVAQEVYITPSYLSFLFKKEMNTSFIDYLHNIRIQKACELMKDIRYKTYDVAAMVGYSDEKYFFQVFKKYKGMTPMQYRNNFLDI